MNSCILECAQPAHRRNAVSISNKIPYVESWFDVEVSSKKFYEFQRFFEIAFDFLLCNTKSEQAKIVDLRFLLEHLSSYWCHRKMMLIITDCHFKNVKQIPNGNMLLRRGTCKLCIMVVERLTPNLFCRIWFNWLFYNVFIKHIQCI